MGLTERDVSGQGAASVSTTEVGTDGETRAVRYGTNPLAEHAQDYAELERIFCAVHADSVERRGAGRGWGKHFQGGVRHGEMFTLSAYNAPLSGVDGGLVKCSEGVVGLSEVHFSTSYGGSLTWDQVVTAIESEVDSTW